MRNDSVRLQELQRLVILDSPREQAYDDITRSLASILDVPIAMVNLLDEDRDWFKSAVGLAMSESPVATSFCQALFKESDELIIVEDTLKDLRFSSHPLVTGPPFIRFYAAARLLVSEQLVGTLCAYDMHPKRLTEVQRDHLQRLGRAVIDLFKARAAAGW